MSIKRYDNWCWAPMGEPLVLAREHDELVAELCAEIKTLFESLHKYGNHADECNKLSVYECVCGFTPAYQRSREFLVAIDAQHASDCAVHNEPAFPAGPCDCAALSKGSI